MERACKMLTMGNIDDMNLFFHFHIFQFNSHRHTTPIQFISLLMAVFSKQANNIKQILIELLVGSRKKKFISGAILLIIGFLLHIRKGQDTWNNLKLKTKRNLSNDKKGKGQVDAVFMSRIKKLLKIVIPSWNCQQMLYLTLLTIFLVLRTFLSIYIAGINGKIVKAIIERNFSLFVKRIFNLGLLAIPASFVNSFLEYVNKKLAIDFRKRLTDYFHQTYLQGMTYFQIGNLDSRISNPDQRLTSDIEKWANSLSLIYSNFTKPLLDIVLFSSKLSDLVGWLGPITVILWYFFSGVVIKLISPPFGKLIAVEQQFEGVYRASQTDLVHHSEQIAFYRGNQWQRQRINATFMDLIHHSETIIKQKLVMGVFDSMLVKYGAYMVGYAVVGLPVFGPNSAKYLASVKNDPSAITRDYVRNSSLLINLAKAIGKLVISYKEIQNLAGFTTLVYEMKVVLDDLKKGQYIRTQISGEKGQIQVNEMNKINKGTVEISEDFIQFDHVPIVSPNGDIIVEEMNFKIQKGMNTVITGPNGCGKSSLFRVLGGLWPLTTGTLRRPKMQKLFYIPQRPYLPPGSLRDQIIYPHTSSVKSDGQLKQILEDVELAYIISREGGFNSINDWNDVLSGGEKQRMAMARLFYHKPLFAILDQCTSAVSIDVEAKLYDKGKKMGITLLTVSHRQSIFKFHEHMVRFDGEKGYQVSAVESK